LGAYVWSVAASAGALEARPTDRAGAVSNGRRLVR
jgi:hypothetical protein